MQEITEFLEKKFLFEEKTNFCKINAKILQNFFFVIFKNRLKKNGRFKEVGENHEEVSQSYPIKRRNNQLKI